VQVDDVWHHGRADDPGGEKDALGAGEAGHEEVLGDFAAVRAGVDQLEDEGGDDDTDQDRDPGLQAPVAQLLQAEDREGAGAGDQPGREQGDAEQQVKPEGGTDHLGDVGRHRHQLGLQPEADRGAAREALAAELGQVPAGGDAELGRLRLHQHRDQVGGEHDPEQQVAELGAAGDVGGEVAGVDVGDGGDEGRAEERPEPADAVVVAVERAARRLGDPGLTRKDALDVGLAAAGQLHPRLPSPPGGSRSGPGIGVPCGSWLGSPSLAAISSSRSSEM
jgi:hypothetical protein